MKKINKIHILFILISALIVFTQCVGIDIKTNDMYNEWIEQKPFPVKISFFNNDKIKDVKLIYSFNNSNAREIKLKLTGEEYYYTIPGNEVKSGKLNYYVTFIHKDKEKKSRSYDVRILTYEEARKIFEKRLRKRISFHAPTEAPVIKDLLLTLNVSKSKPSTKVVLHYKTEEQNSYRKKTLNNNNGVFRVVINKEELAQGYNTYYFTVTEDHEDVGELRTLYPGDGENYPLTYNILTIEDLEKIMKKELRESVKHSVPKDVNFLNDLELSLYINYPKNSYLKQLSENKLNVTILYGRSDDESVFKKAKMIKTDKNKYVYKITADELFDGHNMYFFKINDTAESVGNIRITYPKDGASEPFEYNILDEDEVKKSLINDLAQRIIHKPVTNAVEGQDLVIKFHIENMKAGTEAYVMTKRKDDDSYKKIEANLNKNNKFIAVISKKNIKKGFKQYFIRVNEPQKFFGKIKVAVPEEGKKSPYEYKITKLKDLVYSGVEFQKLKDVKYGDPVKIKIKLNFLPDSTNVFLKYRLSDDTMDYHTIAMERDGETFSVNLSKALLQKDKRIDYYFIIKNKRENLDMTYPDKDILPLYFYIKEAGEE